MKDFKFYSPTQVVFGKEAEEQTAQLIKHFGGTKVLVHYGGGSARRSGLLDKLTNILSKEGIPYVELGGVVPNPLLSLVYEGIELCRREKVDFILAIGGGSVIDSSKAIAYGIPYEGDVWDFYQKKGPVRGVMISCRVPENGEKYARQIDLLTPMLWSQCEEWADSKVGRRGEGYQQLMTQKIKECIALAERVIPGLSGKISEVYTSSPLTYRDYTLTSQGSAYGLRKDYNNPMLTTLSPRTPVPNLLLTGQSLMVHGIHGVTMTALMTCAEILGKETIYKKLNQ